MNKTLLDMKLLLTYYKDNNILEPYNMGFGFGDGRLVLDNDVMNILDNMEQKIFIEPLDKRIEKDKEINRLNNIINELEKFVKERIDNVKYNDYDDMLDKLKELKKGNK